MKPKWAQNRKDRKNLVLIILDLRLDSKDKAKVTSMGIKGQVIQDPVLQPTIGNEVDPMVDVLPIKKGKYDVDSSSFTSVCSVLLLSLLLVSGVWLVVAIMNGVICEIEGMINLINNVVPISIIVVIIQMLIFQ